MTNPLPSSLLLQGTVKEMEFVCFPYVSLWAWGFYHTPFTWLTIFFIIDLQNHVFYDHSAFYPVSNVL